MVDTQLSRDEAAARALRAHEHSHDLGEQIDALRAAGAGSDELRSLVGKWIVAMHRAKRLRELSARLRGQPAVRAAG